MDQGFIGQNKTFIEYVKMFLFFVRKMCANFVNQRAHDASLYGQREQCSLRLFRKRAICYQSASESTFHTQPKKPITGQQPKINVCWTERRSTHRTQAKSQNWLVRAISCQ